MYHVVYIHTRFVYVHASIWRLDVDIGCLYYFEVSVTESAAHKLAKLVGSGNPLSSIAT